MDRVDIDRLNATAERLRTEVEDPKPQVLTALNVLELGAYRFPNRVELLGPLIRSGDLAMWFAWRGVGKTQVMLSLGTALAFGGTFLRWKAAAPVGVLYLDGEMAGQVMQERVAGFLPADVSDDLAENFRLFTPDLLQLGQPLPDLSTLSGQQMIESLITETTKVIVIDNISAWCRTGKENESESWTSTQAWLLTLRRRGIAVLLVHHAGKNDAQRGNSKKEDALDLTIKLTRAKEHDPTTGAAFTWTVDKGRHLHGDDAAALELTLKIENGVASWDWKEAESCNHERMVALMDEGLTDAMIAEELGVNRTTAWRARKQAGRLPTQEGKKTRPVGERA